MIVLEIKRANFFPRPNRHPMENPPFRFPIAMTIRCYECGKVFDAVLTSKASHDFPCPVCGKVEVFDLAQWERKAIAWNKKMLRQSRGRR